MSYLYPLQAAREKRRETNPLPRCLHFHVKCHAWRSLSCLFALLHFMATFCTLKREVSLRGEPPTDLRAKSFTSVHICFSLDPVRFENPSQPGPATRPLSVTGGSLQRLRRVERTRVEDVSSLNGPNSPIIVRALSPPQICFHWAGQARGICQTLPSLLHYNSATTKESQPFTTEDMRGILL